MKAIENTINQGHRKIEDVIATLNTKPYFCDSASNSLDVDKGGTKTNEYEADDYESIEIDEEEEEKEFCYYMTRQTRNSARRAKSKCGTRVKGRSLRNPIGIRVMHL